MRASETSATLIIPFFGLFYDYYLIYTCIVSWSLSKHSVLDWFNVSKYLRKKGCHFRAHTFSQTQASWLPLPTSFIGHSLIYQSVSSSSVCFVSVWLCFGYYSLYYWANIYLRVWIYMYIKSYRVTMSIFSENLLHKFIRLGRQMVVSVPFLVPFNSI